MTTALRFSTPLFLERMLNRCTSRSPVTVSRRIVKADRHPHQRPLTVKRIMPCDNTLAHEAVDAAIAQWADEQED
jgi:hypothetical protein